MLFHPFKGQQESSSYAANGITKAVQDTARKHKLFKLLHNELSLLDSVEHIFASYEVPFVNEQFVVVVIRLDQFKHLEREYRAEDIYSFKYAIMNIALELLRRDWACEGLENGLDHVTLMINGEWIADEQLQVLHTRAAEILASIDQYLGIKATAGIGTVERHVQGLRQSYRNALTASDYRAIKGQQSVISYADIEAQDNSMHDYPYDLESLLLGAIRQNHADNAGMYLDQFIEAIQCGSLQDSHLYLMQLGSVLSRLAKVPHSAVTLSDYHARSFSNELLSLDTLEQKKEYILSGLIKQMVAKDHHDQQKKEELLAAAINYIKANYGNSELTIDMVAEHIQYSASYMRRLFKEVHNSSPTEFLFNYRLEAAKKLLEETEDTAKVIAEKVGYLNTKYFYSIFKKNVGLTTYEYREQYRNG